MVQELLFATAGVPEKIRRGQEFASTDDMTEAQSHYFFFLKFLSILPGEPNSMKQKIHPTGQYVPSATNSYEIGRHFEEYVISLFNKDHFWLLDWQMSKKRAEYRHLDLNYPDLYLLFEGKKHYRFAVECKFLKKIKDGEQFRWAKDREIKSYKRYQAEFNIPVFIVIGIGGKPSAPEKLFVTPLYNLYNSTFVYESDLMPYKRKPDQRFFYDTVQLKLF